MYYIHKDHLGSYETITDEKGRIIEKLNFDPCLSAETYGQAGGRRRNTDTWTFDNVPEETLFDRGFTGHEHLDVFGLVNMNGRVYDPWLGRMLSPDPYLQSPSNSQNYNRYTYAMNNPLKYTDPSGYMYGPLNEYEPEGYVEEGNYSHNIPVYDNHGAMISFGYGGNNFSNTGFTGSWEEKWTDTDGDGIDDNVTYEFIVRDNFVETKGIVIVSWEQVLVTEVESTRVTVGGETFVFNELINSYIEWDIDDSGGGFDWGEELPNLDKHQVTALNEAAFILGGAVALGYSVNPEIGAGVHSALTIPSLTISVVTTADAWGDYYRLENRTKGQYVRAWSNTLATALGLLYWPLAMPAAGFGIIDQNGVFNNFWKKFDENN